MIPELGHFALIIALALSLAQGYLALAGAHYGNTTWMSAARPAAYAQCLFVALSFGCLTWSFLQNDFSVLYVASNSNTKLPIMYRIAAVWGAHEGSLLLWALVLALWTAAVARFSRAVPERFAVRVLGVMAMIAVGFLLFMLMTSNPFERLLPAAIEGRDLNPLLQDPALAIHPPMLYVGYVGFSVAFAFAVAALLEGRLDAVWAKWTRPWTLAAWLALTLGIALGSWWAYYELGWGGWWFWDPVENASFMPWLTGTALLHSLAVTEKRGIFKSWTLLLAISAFSLSLLGTFLVRSGVLVSVHAFATDPARGVFILMFLVAVIGSALALYAWRAPQLAAPGGFSLVSREAFLLVNNVLLMVATGLILFGTLYPLFLDALDLGKISVGPPYFSVAFIVPMLPMVAFMAYGMHSTWLRTDPAKVNRKVRIPLLLAVIAGLALPLLVYGSASVLTYVGIAAAFWLMLSCFVEPVVRWRQGLKPFHRGMPGMILAHFGVGLFVLGVTVTSVYSVEEDLSMRPGDTASIGDYQFRFEGVKPATGPNYSAEEATVSVSIDGAPGFTLHPQKRQYLVQRSPMTEAAIDGNFARDVFVALGEPLGNQVWSMRLQYKPLLRFVWLGAILMALGGLIAAADPRYRRARGAATVPADSKAATAGETA